MQEKIAVPAFTINNVTLQNMKNDFMTQKINKIFWLQIQQKFLDEKEYWKNNKEVSWILHIKFNSARVYYLRLREFIRNKIKKE